MPGYPEDFLENTGSFVPTTQVWDPDILAEVEVTSPEFKELIVRLLQNMNTMAISLNTKEFAFYLTEQLVNGQSYFNPISNDQMDYRPNFRQVFNLGAIGLGANPFPHGLTIANTWKFTRIYGVANKSVGALYYPIPNSDITVFLDAVNINITNASGVTFNSCTLVVEWCKY